MSKLVRAGDTDPPADQCQRGCKVGGWWRLAGEPMNSYPLLSFGPQISLHPPPNSNGACPQTVRPVRCLLREHCAGRGGRVPRHIVPVPPRVGIRQGLERCPTDQVPTPPPSHRARNSTHGPLPTWISATTVSHTLPHTPQETDLPAAPAIRNASTQQESNGFQTLLKNPRQGSSGRPIESAKMATL